METLTDGQRRVLEAIVRFTEAEERPPSTRELAVQLGCHVKTAWQYLSVLERKGYLVRKKGRIRLAAGLARGRGIPIVGRVAAGVPILAVEHVDGYLSTDSLFPTDGSCFCLSVRGDSMKNEGILDGDYVVVRQKPDLDNGEIGVAIIDGEATIKTLRRREGSVVLIPANDEYEMMVVDPSEHEFRYLGEVIGVQRVLKRPHRDRAS